MATGTVIVLPATLFARLVLPHIHPRWAAPVRLEARQNGAMGYPGESVTLQTPGRKMLRTGERFVAGFACIFDKAGQAL